MGHHAPITAAASAPDIRQASAEASLISAVLRDRSILADLSSVTPDCFVMPGAAAAWRTVLDHADIADGMQLAVAAPGLSEDMVRMICGYALGRETILRARHVVLEAHGRRRLKGVCRDILASLDGGDRDVGELMLLARNLVSGLALPGTESSCASDVARLLAGDDPSNAISTGIAALDYVLYGGLHVGQLTGVMARFKVGKSVLMATIARNLEQAAVPTLMVSLERRKNDIERFIAARALGVDARDLDIKNNPAQAAAFEMYLNDQRSLRYIHRPGITIDELRSTIIGAVQRHGIKVVLVDYWQLITSPGTRASREEKQAEAGQMLADLAAELDIAIAITAQVNQEGSPKGSEGLLASAGMVIKLNREENSDFGFLTTVVSNKGKALSKGSPMEFSIELTGPGPHFRDYTG